MDLELLFEQIKQIIDKDVPLISNLSNISSLLYKLDNINWAGFYLVEGDYLYLGPFQGDIACTKIQIGKGVCGTSFLEKRTIIVKDVNKFKGHIACSSLSKSEIVTPVIVDGVCKMVIDIDAPIYDRFNEKDALFLEKIASLIEDLYR